MMTTPSDTEVFTYSFPIQIRWADLDALAHVNNATYLTYFEIARGQYIQTICPDWNWTKDMFLIASARVNFEKELTMNAQKTSVEVRISKLGRKSFDLTYRVVSQHSTQKIIHAQGTTTQVMFDLKLRQTIEIPQWIRTIFTQEIQPMT